MTVGCGITVAVVNHNIVTETAAATAGAVLAPVVRTGVVRSDNRTRFRCDDCVTHSSENIDTLVAVASVLAKRRTDRIASRSGPCIA